MLAEVVSKNRYISVKSAAIELGMSTDYIIERVIYPGLVTAIKAGSRWLIDIESWRQWLDSRPRAN